MDMRQHIASALADAEAGGDDVRASTLRLVLAAVKDRDWSARARDDANGCPEAEIRAILARMVEQREESSRAYDAAGRPDLAEREREEIRIITGLLPKQMADEEISTAASAVVDELDATGLKDIGRCMGTLKARYQGCMDFTKAGKVVRDMLSG